MAQECQVHFLIHMKHLVGHIFNDLFIPITFPKVFSEAHYSCKMLYYSVSIEVNLGNILSYPYLQEISTHISKLKALKGPVEKRHVKFH